MVTEPSSRSGSNIMKRDFIQCFHLLQSGRRGKLEGKVDGGLQ